MEAKGFEPLTLGLQSRCSSQLSYAPDKRTERGRERRGSPFACKVFHLTDDILLDLPQAVRPSATFLLRKEVIQPHLPVRLPCYDFTPVMKPTVDAVLLAVRQTSSGEPHSHGVTGGVYKTRERIHRGILIRDY